MALTPPPHTVGRKPTLARLAKVSGRSIDVLAITLVDAKPALLPVWTKATLRLRHRFTLRRDGFDKTGLIKQDARRNKGSLRQISDRWQIPLWALRRILSPQFPDAQPAPRAHMSEDTYRRIQDHYLQGLTPTESWRSFLDDHGTWLTMSSITKLHIRFTEGDGTP